jgi:hypothetical protein
MPGADLQKPIAHHLVIARLGYDEVHRYRENAEVVVASVTFGIISVGLMAWALLLVLIISV